MTSKDWRPTAFVDTAPGADDASPASPRADAPLLALLGLLVGLHTVAALAVALHPPARGPASLALVLFLAGLAGSGALHLRLLSRTATPRDRGLVAVSFAGLLAGMAALAAAFWAGGWR